MLRDFWNKKCCVEISCTNLHILFYSHACQTFVSSCQPVYSC